MTKSVFKICRRAFILAFTAAGLFFSFSATGSDFTPGIGELVRLDRIPRFKTSIEVGCVSSYDRTGGNDDGFSGKYSFIRREAGGLVLADLKGPGCIYRIWTPTPTDDPMEIYFDGEKTPRIRLPFRELFTGGHDPFLSPISASGAGGFVSYFPIPFRKSCKVVIKAEKVQFYQINYAIYPENMKIESYRPVLTAEEKTQLDMARDLWNSAGRDISRYCAPPGDSLTTMKSHKRLMPGGTAVLFELTQPGRIAGLRMKPADRLAGRNREILIRMTWDGGDQPAVLCPAGDFFGASWGEPAMRSLLVGTESNADYVYFPMPYDRSAKIELVSEAAGGEPLEIESELVFSPTPRAGDEGRFHAAWRRENPTRKGSPFTFLDIRGRGHLAACFLQSQGMEPGFTPFFEGDDQTWIDGKPAVNGTGSEDFFNGGWYDVPDRWEERKSFPLSGCLDYKKYAGRSAGYRLFLTDAYPFRTSLLQTMEHGPEKNALAADYCATTFFYAAEGLYPAPASTPAPMRRAEGFRRILFTPGWNVPIHAFSFQNVTLTKKTEAIGGSEIRFLSMRSDGEDVFGRPFVAFEFDIPEAGRYAVGLEAMTGPSQGMVRMYRNENSMGEAADLFSDARGKSAAIPMGILDLREGINILYFKVVGRNPKAAGSGFDPVTVFFDRLD